jgi:hypothetical protein
LFYFILITFITYYFILYFIYYLPEKPTEHKTSQHSYLLQENVNEQEPIMLKPSVSKGKKHKERNKIINKINENE